MKLLLSQTAAICVVFSLSCMLGAQTPSSSNPNSRDQPSHHQASDASANNTYRNSAFGFTCKIPEGWVLRTEEMDSQDDAPVSASSGKSVDAGKGGRVLLSAFSRPPEAKGEDINSSILIAIEPASAYPGLKDAAQYFGPVTEVAKAQGFDVDEDPYEFGVGTKKMVRGDYEKDVGSRVMHQSTLVMLSHGYAVSFTFIGGTEDEVEELVSGLSFPVTRSK